MLKFFLIDLILRRFAGQFWANTNITIVLDGDNVNDFETIKMHEYCIDWKAEEKKNTASLRRKLY